MSFHAAATAAARMDLEWLNVELGILPVGFYNSSVFGTVDSGPSMARQTIFQASRHDQVEWIAQVSRFAQSGILQALVLSTSVCSMAFILSTSQKQDVSFKSRAFPIRWPYEVLSQAARIAALVSVNMAFLRGSTNLLNVLALVYAFAIGLLRLVSRPRRRRMILGQVNYVLTAILLLLLVAQTLPCIQTGVTCGCDSSIAAAIASLAAAFLIAITTPTEWIPPNTNIDIPGWAAEHEAPALEETCSWIDYYCTYNWLDPILWKGIRNKLDMSGIPRLAWYDEPMYLLRQLQRARSIHQKTLFTVIRYQWKELTIMAIMSMAAFAVENISPYAMYRLLDHISDPAAAVYQPWVWLALMFFGPLVRSVLYQQYVFTSTRLVVRIRAGMTQELYHRALESMELDESHFHAEDSPGLTHKSTAAGRLANLMASDIQSIFRARDVIQVFIGVPVGTAISLFGMYRMLGWPSLVGTAVLLIGAPITIWLGQLQFRAQKKVRQAQDSRISLVTEYLASIRAIKYFAWEDAITAKIVDSRSVEQNQLWQVSLMSALMSQITQVFPYLSLLVMFGLHVALRGSLDASMAFTTVVLVKNIRRNLVQASTVGRSIAAAVVSLRRLDDYFGNTVPLTRYPKGPLRIQGASFRRSKKAVFTLEDVSLEFAQGGLNVISGPSGSGKTTLLLSILGETYLEKGSVTRPDDVAYASQSAWLQNDTIRANILFGSAMEKARYDRVVKACCLLVDFKELPNGDNTIVGENGTSLSGGQKARVALARALYSKAPLLLLDDIFSALDAKTSAGVWKYCFCGDLLRGRTTVLVTQVPWITDQADLSIILDRGRVQEVDPHIGVVRQPIEIAQVLGGGGDDDDEGDAVAEPTLQANGDPLNDEAKVANHDKPKDIVSQEAKASGKLGRFASLQYMAYFGHPAIGFGCILFMVTTNVFFFGNGLWLSEWVEAYSHEGYVDVAYYMGIYSLICVIEILTWGCSIILFEWGAWRAAKKLHNDFIHAIMSVSLSWFKVIPIGRITNRFSGDMTSIDSMLGSMLRACVDAILSLLFRLAAVSTIMPIFMVPAFFTCLFGVVIGEIYTRAAVIAKRMTSSAQSPIFSQYGDTLAGLSIIRARAGIPQEFMLELASKLRVWAAVQQTSFNLNRWVAIRVDLVTALVALCAGIIALSQTGYISAALVGFSLSNSNSLNKSILYLVRAMNDWEVEIQSFHRVKEYVKLEPEEKNDEPFPEQGEDNEYVDDESQVIPSDWPRSGDIEFRNVTIRYDMDGPDILTDVNLKFKAGERVAVVGRTGSGKSTLVLSLLRFTHVVSGQILYDGIDITKIPRGRLRESLTIIPQEAVLFNGSVQTNLDPTGLVSEEKLLRALDNCRGIASFSDDTPDFAETISLASEVDARGENFSHGQRQVLSLCRALIRQSKLMLLDEATASMDYETDRGIQQVLRDELAVAGGGRTLVTIAHRLRTIIDYDSVIVMSAGRVVECGSPQDLYHAKGQFYDMVQHSGEVEVLQQVLDSSSEEGRQ